VQISARRDRLKTAGVPAAGTSARTMAGLVRWDCPPGFGYWELNLTNIIGWKHAARFRQVSTTGFNWGGLHPASSRRLEKGVSERSGLNHRTSFSSPTPFSWRPSTKRSITMNQFTMNTHHHFSEVITYQWAIFHSNLFNNRRVFEEVTNFHKWWACCPSWHP